MAFRSSPYLGKSLAAHGLLPKNCSNVEIHMPANGAVMLRFERFLEPYELPEFAAAFQEAADEMTKAEKAP